MPRILHKHLALSDSETAAATAHRYEHLPYFSHALEVLLHTVLDDEVDNPPTPEESLLPSIITFLSSFSDYLNIIVQCTRKTEVRSWRTLFAHLPPPKELFDLCLDQQMLKTAGGYLLILQTLEDPVTSSEQCVRLLERAREAEDWELCKELARFLMALDRSGGTLRKALETIHMDFRGVNGETVHLQGNQTSRLLHQGVSGLSDADKE